jgi:hypothetical protein
MLAKTRFNLNSIVMGGSANAVGGIESIISGFKTHIFTRSGTFTTPSSMSVDVLIVGGGGGGGMDMGGGGGGGEVYTGTMNLGPGSYSVVVGPGGWGAPGGSQYRADGPGQAGSHQYTVSATVGGNSSFNGVTAIGGGYGGSSYFGYTPNYGYGSNGASGGGASGYSDGSGGRQGAGTAGKGFDGGSSIGQYYSGGGGGAGGPGLNGGAPNGGPGLPSAILGTLYYWGAGGGGGSYSSGIGGNGGLGGGGGGAIGATTGGVGYRNGAAGGGGGPSQQANTPGGDAGPNTGSGGGGGAHYQYGNRGGNGGDGIVVIRYAGGKVADDPYVPMTYILSGNLTAFDNGTTMVSIFKTSGGFAWDNHAYSTTPFTAPCTIEFYKYATNFDTSRSQAMVSWNADPTSDASYTSLDYASFPYRTDNYSVYHNSTQVHYATAWDPNQKFYVVYGTDGFIRHYNGSTQLYNVNYGTGQTVYFDSSFMSPTMPEGGLREIRVIRKAWNGTKYV